jgi:hypothetical protein
MHILIVDGHPERSEERFCHDLVASYAEGARQSGYDVRVVTIAKPESPVLAGLFASPCLDSARDLQLLNLNMSIVSAFSQYST